MPKHLLPRLNGFELMMAPYAVAHMKLAMVLKDTGYEFGENQRLNVFLTNSLEEAGKSDMQIRFEDDPLASESIEANAAKKNNGINVIIGNPPYSVESSNKGDWINELMKIYKSEPNSDMPLQERNSKVINDDYVKFIRYSQYLIHKNGNGIVSFIIPHGIISNITFRGARSSLIKDFNSIYVIDLHGNKNLHEVSPDGSEDDNVFDIMQGVCIIILIKNCNIDTHNVFYYDLFGKRDYKYTWLSQTKFNNVNFTQVTAFNNYFFFNRSVEKNENQYNQFFSLNDLFINKSSGVKTSDDNTVIANNISQLKEQINAKYPNEFDDEKVKAYAYRIFDTKLIYYDTTKIGRSRIETMKHMNNNIGIMITKQSKLFWKHIFLSEYITDINYLSNSGLLGGGMIAPLFVNTQRIGKVCKEANFNIEIINKISKSLNMSFNENNEQAPDSFSAIDLLDYIYAILHSVKYRDKYQEALKIDFPRVPYPTDKELFWKLVALGSQLRECHLMKTEFDVSAYTLTDGSNEVVKPAYKNGRVYINKTQYFDNVPQAQWEQYIGGYQPLQKWLKDRKKTVLTAEEIEHYKKIIAALRRTEEIMGEIDMVLEV